MGSRSRAVRFALLIEEELRTDPDLYADPPHVTAHRLLEGAEELLEAVLGDTATERDCARVAARALVIADRVRG